MDFLRNKVINLNPLSHKISKERTRSAADSFDSTGSDLHEITELIDTISDKTPAEIFTESLDDETWENMQKKFNNCI